jgi:branched-chain amino acid transport system permease protein
MIQSLLDGVLTGAIISLGAIGLTLIMHMLRFANFSYSELLAIGAYSALVFDSLFSALVPVLDNAFAPLTLSGALALAMVIAMVLTGLSALIIDRWCSAASARTLIRSPWSLPVLASPW